MRELYRSSEDAQRVRDWCAARLASWSVEHSRTAVDTTLGLTSIVSAGEGDDVCVYLPGTNFNAGTSTRLLEELAARCRVVAADLPGQPGLSAAGRPEDELGGYRLWVTELLGWVREQRPGARVLLAGHSRGAAVALSAPPDAVHGLVLLSPAGLVGVRPSYAMLRATLPWLLRPDASSSRRLARLMSGPGHPVPEDTVEWLTLVARATRTTGAPGPLPKQTLTAWRPRSVQILLGEHDAFFPPARLAEQATARLGVPTTVVPGAGHLLVDERPHLVAEACGTMLGSPPVPPGETG